MVMQVNQVLCAGCGVCVETCSVGAIQLVENQAVIDEDLCTSCGACLEACPNGAITIIARPVPETAIMTLSEVESRPVLARVQDRLQVIATPARGLLPLAGTALAYLGREAAPRLVDVLITALDRKLEQPEKGDVSTSSITKKSRATQRRGKQRQTRYRGGQIGIRNSKGRR